MNAPTKLLLLAGALALTVFATAAVRAHFQPRHIPVARYLTSTTYADGDWNWADSKTGTVKGNVNFSTRRPPQPVVIYLVKLGADGKPGEQGLYAKPGTLSVSQKGGKFEPSFAVLVRKQTVKFLNDEDKEISHNVYFLGDVEADLGIFEQGESRDHTFDDAGEVSVHCSIHKRMDGKFFITPSPAYAVLEADDSSFEIKGVPVGKYRVHTWQRQKRFKDFEATLEVKANEATTVTVEMSR